MSLTNVVNIFKLSLHIKVKHIKNSIALEHRLLCFKAELGWCNRVKDLPSN